MTDKIEVDVEDLRAVTTIATRQSVWLEVAGRLRAALAEYDKAEQERLDALVMIHRDDTDAIAQYSTPYRWATTFRYPWYEAAPATVEALGEFYPHQIDHAFTQTHPDDAVNGCEYCYSPSWAHTPPAVPDWQTNPNVLVIETCAGDHLLLRDGEKWRSQTGRVWTWREVAADGPITPVGYRRDPDSITIPKSALDGLSAEWCRANALMKESAHPVTSRVFRAIADALEAGAGK